VADEQIWTAAELEQLSFDERLRLLDDHIVTDLSTVSPDFLERARANARAHLEERGLIERQGDGD
jgi:hypothetical protein